MGVMRIVVAEDEKPIRDLLVHHLEREGFRCDAAGDGTAALRAARNGADLLLLDLGLPVVDGLDVVRALRREHVELPILVLTSRAEEVDRVVGLEVGADDYVVKPFSPREVVARVKALTRRARTSAIALPATLRFGRLEVDEAAREARVDGARIALKPREFALLLELARNAGVALARAVLLQRVWGLEFEGDERTVDIHVSRLRRTLEHGAKLRRVVHTVHRFGYKFDHA
ncbi:MAG TPA: response regulator transcription factor [Candidatus Baltobacteraceae bacterium]|nr:response regulator transcription factor [Candidatus Baltobacteraceae bacterium]